MTFLRRGGPTTSSLLMLIFGAVLPVGLVLVAGIVIWLTGGKP